MRFAVIGVAMFMAGQAEAGLTLCNDGGERASVAIAYATAGVWTSEGWWGIDPGACAVVQAGDLRQQHYYFSLSGTDFAGEGFAFCTKPDAFTLTGADGDCAGLGAESRAFSHIDTGPDAADFTFRLTAGAGAKRADAATPAFDAATPAFDEIPLQAGDVASLLESAAMPSFERGILGEPFLVDAILQGCGPTEGSDACTFYAEGARWIVSAAGQSNPAAMQAMADLPVGAALRISGDMLSFGDVTAEAAIASLEQIDDPYATARAAMQGEWVSADDPQSRVQIAGSEWTDIYGDELLAVAILTLSDSCGGAQGGVLLSQQRMGYDPADLQCYEVLSVDGARMELSYLGRGNTLTFLRP